MNAATVANTGNVRVEDANGMVLLDSITYYPNPRSVAAMVPRAALSGPVTVTLTDAIEDTNGIALPGREWSFRVD